MIKQKISIERQINERQYQFLVPPEAALAEILAIVEDIKNYVVQRINEAEKAVAESVKVEQNPPEDKE